MPSQTLRCGQAVIEMGATSPMRSAAHSHSAEYVSTRSSGHESDSQNIRPPWAVSSTFDWRAVPCLRWAMRWALCWMVGESVSWAFWLVCVACSDPGADRGSDTTVEGSRRQSMVAVHGTLYPHRTGLRW